MGKKDYEALADAFAEAYRAVQRFPDWASREAGIEQAAHSVACTLGALNPRFDEEKFLKRIARGADAVG